MAIPFVGPAFAVSANFIATWVSDSERPAGLDGTFEAFVDAHNKMQKAISDKLLILADETDNYKNLREEWKGELEFNGKKYTLRDLAGSPFPTEEKGTEYVALRTAAFDRFRKYFWNMMIIKASSLKYSGRWEVSSEFSPSQYAAESFYLDSRYKASYLRGYYESFSNTYFFRRWYYEFDGVELSPDAGEELFKDDYPKRILNPDGLFYRDYVFKQFRYEKPDFFGYHELRKTLDTGTAPGDGYGFDPDADDFVFTGGDFPELTQH